RADRLPDEEGRNLAPAERRRQHLGVDVLHRHLARIDAVLPQIFGDEPRARRADAGGDGLAVEVLRLAVASGGDRDVPLGVRLQVCIEQVTVVHSDETSSGHVTATNDMKRVSVRSTRKRKTRSTANPSRQIVSSATKMRLVCNSIEDFCSR